MHLQKTMKKSWLKRKTALKATKPWNYTRKPLKQSGSLKRTRIKVVGHSEPADLKTEIQAIIREMAIIIDGGCILRHYPEAGQCAGFRNDGELILQAEHLITRGNTATFGDMRNIVCLCRHHHGHFKPEEGLLYWDLVRRYVGKKRWDWIQRAQADRSPHKIDLKLVKIVLLQDLKKLKQNESN